MTTLVILTVIAIALLIAGLAFYLFWAGTLLGRVAGNLEECAGLVRTITDHAKPIRPNLERINETGRVIAGALPLLYGMAEQIVVGATWPTAPSEPPAPEEPTRPAAGHRPSRMREATGAPR